jgi:site-specific DNA-adenine methylase
MQALENIQRLQNIERLENIEIINISYKNLNVETPIDETVIYCDPPYR